MDDNDDRLTKEDWVAIYGYLRAANCYRAKLARGADPASPVVGCSEALAFKEAGDAIPPMTWLRLGMHIGGLLPGLFVDGVEASP